MIVPSSLPALPALLLDSAVRSLIVAALVGTGLLVSRTRNVVAQKTAWTLVLLAAFIMPVLAPWAAHLPSLLSAPILIPKASWLRYPTNGTLDGPTTATGPAASMAPLTTTEIPASSSNLAMHSEPAPPSAGAPHRFPAPSISSDSITVQNSMAPDSPAQPVRPLSPADLLLILYATISALLIMRMVLGLAAAIRLWRGSEPVSDLRIPRGLRVRSSRALPSPVTIASGIILPSDYAAWDTEKLRIVLAHESCHVRQGDFYLQLCASLYTALFWFSPLGWWLKRKLSDLSETISDGAAIEHAASNASYAQVLLEFAALPRPISTGVAMANHRHVISRIERLLNESSFRQAFAGGRARIAAAVLLVPVALYAATALLPVKAAQTTPPPPATAPIPEAPASPAPATPAISGLTLSGPDAPAIAPAPAAPASIQGVQAASPAPPPAEPAVAPVAPEPPASWKGWRSQRHYAYDDNGETYALISGNGKVTYADDWRPGQTAELDKARRMAHGDFLWFTHDGKSYVMDDPQIVEQIKQMYAPMEALGKQQEELGRQQEELGKKQEALGRQMEQASVPTPEMTEQIAAVEKAAAALKAAKGQTLTQDQLADMQKKLADLQGKLGELQGSIGSKQGELGAKQGELGAQQGKLGEQQGSLGEEQGRIAQEADRKVKSIIDESLKNGKARPVE